MTNERPSTGVWNPRACASCWALVALAAAIPACSTVWFRPVEQLRGSVHVFCVSQGLASSNIIVGVYVDSVVEDASFVVQPVGDDGAPTGEKPALRESVYLEKGTTSCVRVPLPASSRNVRQYQVSAFGRAGSKRVNGGQMVCEPARVETLACTIL